jgi:hypothetical protein
VGMYVSTHEPVAAAHLLFFRHSMTFWGFVSGRDPNTPCHLKISTSIGCPFFQGKHESPHDQHQHGIEGPRSSEEAVLFNNYELSVETYTCRARHLRQWGLDCSTDHHSSNRGEGSREMLLLSSKAPFLSIISFLPAGHNNISCALQR